MKHWLRRAVLATLLVASHATDVVAQQYWFAPNKNKGALQWVVMLGVVILLAIPAFMNPKRSHMDS